jgi:hypothetical protein
MQIIRNLCKEMSISTPRHGFAIFVLKVKRADSLSKYGLRNEFVFWEGVISPCHRYQRGVSRSKNVLKSELFQENKRRTVLHLKSFTESQVLVHSNH